ncbi:ABC transporter permease [Dinghuibacter silviterrae]|uniref:Putative ABC transport system permease protein n=1 Tax=Dinghuibacter silviterrae TaxID=1539049 RepID=A0A4R8DTV6_9BACT|nr:ABC transporter permease [Dinghuibacter silviterrae]TDX00847.1 putative ABC transport system permease protein [Dinghuibacter silviterrae]
MLFNYFKIALRHFRKNTLATVINLTGLTIGLTSCLLITVYILHELSYDGFETNGDRIARVIMEYAFNGSKESKTGNYTSTKVATTFQRVFPEIASAVRMEEAKRVVTYQDKQFSEDRFMYADSSFLTVFSFRLLDGDAHTALSGSHKVLLTATAARKYFGDGPVIGQMLKVGPDTIPYFVTGIIQDCPSNSQIKFDLLCSFSSLGVNQDKTYWNANYTTYLLLKSPAAIASLQAKLPAFMQSEMKGTSATVNFTLEPMRRVHLFSEYGGFEPNNNITYIYVLGGVALLILAIACFTYINLSTARSMERAREVGVRKVMGAGGRALFWQFIGESLMLAGVSILLSLLAAALVLPAFDGLTGTALPTSALYSPSILLTLLGFMACVGLAAGAYPALVLSGFQPVKVLKGSFKHTDKGQWMRQSLIVFQFVISVFLIVSTVVVRKQLYYIQHRDMGVDRDHVLVLPLDRRMRDKIDLFKTEFTSVPGVLHASATQNSPINIVSGFTMRSAAMPASQNIAVSANPIDEDYVKTVGLQLVAGEDLTHQDMQQAALPDSIQLYHYILNESAARQLGWTPQTAIGQRMYMESQQAGIVKGVVRDFNFASMHDAIKPLVLFPGTTYSYQWLLKLRSGDPSPMIAALAAKWKDLVPYRPFEYHFLDEDYDRMYQSEIRLGQALDLFAGIAIVLACLGLFGLSSYAAQQRVREVGIRKVLGASVGQIVLLLSRDFVRLAGIAFLVALPFSWWAMHRWLQDFAYRTSLSVFVFVLAGVLTLALTLVTVSIKAVAAALMNPVKNLRTE